MIFEFGDKNEKSNVQGSKSKFWRCAKAHYAVRLWHCDNASVSTESAPAELRDYQSITKHPYTLYIDRSCPNWPKGYTKSIPSVYSTSRSHQEHPGKSKKKRYVFAADRIFKTELIIYENVWKMKIFDLKKKSFSYNFQWKFSIFCRSQNFSETDFKML